MAGAEAAAVEEPIPPGAGATAGLDCGVQDEGRALIGDAGVGERPVRRREGLAPADPAARLEGGRGEPSDCRSREDMHASSPRRARMRRTTVTGKGCPSCTAMKEYPEGMQGGVV